MRKAIFKCGCIYEDNLKRDRKKQLRCPVHGAEPDRFETPCEICGEIVVKPRGYFLRYCRRCAKKMNTKRAVDFYRDNFKVKESEEIKFTAIFMCGCRFDNFQFVSSEKKVCPEHKKPIIAYERKCKKCDQSMILSYKNRHKLICDECYLSEKNNTAKSRMERRGLIYEEFGVEKALEGFFENNLKLVMDAR